jgi:hypothetical protein
VTSRQFKMSDFPPQYFGFELGVIELPDLKSANLTVQMNSPSCVTRGLVQIFRTGKHLIRTRNQFQSPCQNLL